MPCRNFRWSITQSFLPQICITLEAVLLKLYAKLSPGWALIRVNFDTIQKIGLKVRGGSSFVSGRSFMRLRYILLHHFHALSCITRRKLKDLSWHGLNFQPRCDPLNERGGEEKFGRWLFFIERVICTHCNLVPRPSHHPVFDRFQYAKTEREGKAWSILSCEWRQCLRRWTGGVPHWKNTFCAHILRLQPRAVRFSLHKGSKLQRLEQKQEKP